MTAETKDEATAAKQPTKKTAALVARKRVRKSPGYSRGGYRAKASKKGTAVVVRPKTARTTPCSEERRLANAIMLQQRDGGMTVPAIARVHRTSVNAVYQRLWRARMDMKSGAELPTDLMGTAPSRDANDVAYLRGRVDQLEALFVKAITAGMDKFLRVASA